MAFLDPYSNHIREIGKEAERERIRMNIINHYRTSNFELVNDRCKEYFKLRGGSWRNNYNVNKIKLFKDIPDGIEILIDYVNATAIRMMNIPSEIVYESIYRYLPELFEE